MVSNRADCHSEHRQQHREGASGEQACASAALAACCCTTARLCILYKAGRTRAQKEATGSLPRFSLDLNILRQYCRSRQWLAGLGADLGGALFMVAAFALAPVSLVQPVSGVGLVSLAVFSHFWLKVRPADTPPSPSPLFMVWDNHRKPDRL